VRVFEAKVDKKRLQVKMHVTNETSGPIEIDRDGMSIRLADGRVLPRASGITTMHKPYVLAPGSTRPVHVDFRGEELATLAEVWLVVGGIRLAGEVQPRVIGEVALTRTHQLTPIASAGRGEPTASRTSVDSPGIISIAVDLSALAPSTFAEIDGSRLEKEVVVRLVQDGFAVVAPSEHPTITIRLVTSDDGLLLETRGPAPPLRRPVPRSDDDPAEVRLEVAQKASDLAREAATQIAGTP
jgi:hypothetical protein